jgi:hypothetical protein
MKYLLHTKRYQERVFWHHDYGWGDLEGATVYTKNGALSTWYFSALDGELLYIGDNEEDKMLAALILDIMDVLEQQDQLNSTWLAKLAVASLLASWPAG